MKMKNYEYKKMIQIEQNVHPAEKKLDFLHNIQKGDTDCGPRYHH